MSFIQKAKDYAKANPQKFDQAVETVGDLVDKKTGGKYAAAVEKAQEVVKTQLKK